MATLAVIAIGGGVIVAGATSVALVAGGSFALYRHRKAVQKKEAKKWKKKLLKDHPEYKPAKVRLFYL